MSEQMSLFDMDGIGADHMRAIKSTDWKWSFSDYPKEKNRSEVQSSAVQFAETEKARYFPARARGFAESAMRRYCFTGRWEVARRKMDKEDNDEIAPCSDGT